MTSRDRLVLNAILRASFPSFLQRCFLTLNPGAIFHDNWHIEALAYHLELVRIGKLRRLIVNIPPRFLKSTVCSVAFPAFLLGHDPTKRLIVASYSGELATKLSNDFRVILQAPWYRSAFPGTRISQIKSTEAEVMTTRLGYRLAASVGGTLTGRGGNIVIIDEPMKAQDAYSDTRRKAVNDWFDNTLLSRLDDKRTGAIIVVMQRLHCDDLTGKQLRGPDDWTLLSLPAIAEHDEQIQIGENTFHFRKAGDLLHPKREPAEVLDGMLAHLGSEMFSAHYQQKPTPARGNMIKREWVRRYDDLPAQTPSTYVLQSYDTATTGWSVCTTWRVQDGRYYLADVMRGRFNWPTLKARAIEHARAHCPTTILVEDTDIGKALIPELRNQGFTVVGVQVVHNKEIRMAIQSGKFESGLVFFPRCALWLADLEAEVFAFPASPHDDQIDSISQALAYAINNALWTDEAAKGWSKVATALAWDQAFGRLAGRPW
jgi:predicted phage terminase large subunit-like protein